MIVIIIIYYNNNYNSNNKANYKILFTINFALKILFIQSPIYNSFRLKNHLVSIKKLKIKQLLWTEKNSNIIVIILLLLLLLLLFLSEEGKMLMLVDVTYFRRVLFRL